MLTFNQMIEDLCDAGEISFAGKHYVDAVDVIVAHRPHDNFGRIAALVEKRGAQLRYDDEIITDDSGYAHELNPGYHGETPTYAFLGECEIWAEHEADEHLELYAERLMVRTTATGLPASKPRPDHWRMDFSELGFAKFEKTGASGFHPGQDDTPQAFLAAIHAAQGECDVIFAIDDVGQFDCHFSAWYRPVTNEDA